MPKAFDSWQVFPHRPLEKLSENLWRVEGDLPGGQGTRVMTIARLQDGGLIVHNAIALEEPMMQEVEAFGKPAAIIVPNGFHRLDAKIFKARYPEARVFCPTASRKKVEQVVAVDGSLTDVPGDENVRISHIDGMKEREGVLEVRSSDGATVTFNDAICNLPKLSGAIGFFLAPTGCASVPRFTRWMLVKDKAAFRGHLERLAKTPDLKRIIVSHGKVIDERPGEALSGIAGAV